jgi:hypothetical protein
MMLTLALSLSLLQVPLVDPPRGPGAYETAKLFFLTGDVAKASEVARSGLATDGKRCRALLRWLAEYGYLANRLDELTPEQARELLELNRKIAPGGVGKLTQKVIARFIDKPLQVARLRAQAGDAAGAAAIARETLRVDPKHPEVLDFLASLSGADGGRAQGNEKKRLQP